MIVEFHYGIYGATVAQRRECILDERATIAELNDAPVMWQSAGKIRANDRICHLT